MGFIIGFLTSLMAWGINIALYMVSAIFFRIAWNGLIPKFCGFIPELYQSFTYWEVVGFLVLLHLAGDIISKLSPKLVSINNSKGSE